jgi:hypothetical protein
MPAYSDRILNAVGRFMMSDKTPVLPEAPVTTPDQPTENVSDVAQDSARREALKRLGMYSAFVTPALLAVFTSSASAQIIEESGATN